VFSIATLGVYEKKNVRTDHSVLFLSLIAKQSILSDISYINFTTTA